MSGERQPLRKVCRRFLAKPATRADLDELDYTRVLLYQDGLPKVQNVALQIEKQIVDDLARAGVPTINLFNR